MCAPSPTASWCCGWAAITACSPPNPRMPNWSPPSPAPPRTRSRAAPPASSKMWRAEMADPDKVQTDAQLDRSDSRVRRDDGITGALRGFIDRVRMGDLGILPVLIGIVVIATVFWSLNPIFLAPNNLANLLFDAAAVGCISLGV